MKMKRMRRMSEQDVNSPFYAWFFLDPGYILTVA